MFQKPIIILCGKSGSGKSTIAQIMCKKYGMKEIKSYTTRSPRFKGEDTHIFVNNAEYKKQKENDQIIAETEFAGHYYFTTKEQIENNDIVVWDKAGIEEFRNRKDHRPFISLYIDVDDDTLIKRMRNRGDSEEKIRERVRNDKKAFEGCKELCDGIINGNNSLDLVVQEVVWNANYYSMFCEEERESRRNERINRITNETEKNICMML